MTTRNGRRFALPILQGTIAVAIAGTVLTLSGRPLGGAQATPPPTARQAEWAQRSRNFEQTGLAEPFKGITADGTVVPNLYAVRATGVSTAPVVTAANAFLGALSEPQRTKTVFAVDDPEWRKWMNQHFYIRQGVGFDEMSEAQRQAAFGLIKASLSAKGLTLDARHHAPEPHARRVEQQRLRAVRRVVLLDDGDGHALGDRSPGAGSSMATT